MNNFVLLISAILLVMPFYRVVPSVRTTSVNADTIRRYEKFEAVLELENVGIENPYDPDDIDVYATFTTPSGRQIRIIAFYDNYKDAGIWRLRFSPGETGRYTYRMFVEDAGGKGSSQPADFTAVDSDHRGRIRPSRVNPHYFTYDDGTSWYGVGVYSPWRNDMQRFETYAEHDADSMLSIFEKHDIKLMYAICTVRPQPQHGHLGADQRDERH